MFIYQKVKPASASKDMVLIGKLVFNELLSAPEGRYSIQLLIKDENEILSALEGKALSLSNASYSQSLVKNNKIRLIWTCDVLASKNSLETLANIDSLPLVALINDIRVAKKYGRFIKEVLVRPERKA